MQKYTLQLKGYVGGMDFDTGYVDYVLSQHANEPVSVLIDSLGGSLATALSIAASFRNHGNVSVHFVGMNASAATIASLGAKRITMDANAMYLAHKCSVAVCQWASLNADQLSSEIASLEQMKSDLEKMDANVASMYAKKCRKDQADLLELMKVGGWLSAGEALEWGFVDELTSMREDKAPVLTDAVASAMAAVGMPIPQIQIQDEQGTQFTKFLTVISNFFKSSTAQNQQPQTKHTMNKILPFLVAALATDALRFEDGVCSLTEAQCDALEALLAQQDNQVKALQTQLQQQQALIEARDNTIATQQERLDAQAKLLESQPGAATSQVVNNGKPSNEPKDEVTQFMETSQSARALFDRLP